MASILRYRMAVVLLTAALVATLTVALTGGDRADAVDGPVDLVYIATGRNFPDALAGSTLAVATGAPLLTVEKDPPIPDATIEALEALDPARIIVLGGPAAVSDAVLGSLTAYARSGSVTRIEGTDRHDTAGAIAEALPDRVADADRLDGLDSTAFLRSSGGALTGPLVAPEVRYTAPRFETTVVSHLSFVPADTAALQVTYGSTETSASGGASAPLRAPIALPDGVRIEEVTIDIRDASVSNNLRARVVAITTGLSETTLAEVETTDSTPMGQVQDTTSDIGHVVDNATFQYRVEVGPPIDSGWDVALAVRRVLITYTRDAAP